MNKALLDHIRIQRHLQLSRRKKELQEDHLELCRANRPECPGLSTNYLCPHIVECTLTTLESEQEQG